MIYPTITDYISSVLISESFRTKSFLRPLLDSNKQPIFIAGGPAVVFKMYDVNNPKKFYALKLFTQEVENRERNFREIHTYIKENPNEYFIDYEYISEEIWVNDNEYPILLMNWIEGETLSSYIKKQCENNNTENLKKLAGKFDAMALWLLKKPIAHGDLKPDNIIITPYGDLKLVDYDGMYVPSLQGTNSLELGTAEYRHPKRTSKDFNSNLDDFPILVLSLSLHTLSKKPSIYQHQKGGDALLFRSQDYKQILSFPHFQYFQENQEDQILFPRFAMLQYSITQPIIQLQGLKTLIESTAIYKELTTKVEEEDGEWIDEYGVKYSANRKKLIKGNKDLITYKIKEGCRVICDNAFFQYKSLTSIEIPNSVTSIGDSAFYSCESLESIVIPNSVTSIGDSAFSSCENLQSIEIPNSVTSIGTSAFSGCTNLINIELSNSLKIIKDGVFSKCTSIKSIKIPDSVISIGKCIFNNNNDDLFEHGGVFEDCINLDIIDIPNSVVKIADRAFWGCENLKIIIIPDSVFYIGYEAFGNCKSLEVVHNSDSLIKIGFDAFYYCKSLNSVVVPFEIEIILGASFPENYDPEYYDPESYKSGDYNSIDYSQYTSAIWSLEKLEEEVYDYGYDDYDNYQNKKNNYYYIDKSRYPRFTCDDIPYYDDGLSYSKYGGAYGYDDDTIDSAFEGDPENYWNID